LHRLNYKAFAFASSGQCGDLSRKIPDAAARTLPGHAINFLDFPMGISMTAERASVVRCTIRLTVSLSAGVGDVHDWQGPTMMQQILDTISINGRHYWLAEPAPILPTGLAEALGLELISESTTNCRGWQAHWEIEQGRLLLADLNLLGLPDRVHISFEEIFGKDPPIFALWVTMKLTSVCSEDEAQYRRDDFGVSGPHTRIIGIENGMVVSDERS
jgi:hypothetical protein